MENKDKELKDCKKENSKLKDSIDEIYEPAVEDKVNELSILKEALEKERLEKEDYRDKYVRLLAEFENFKKRQDRDRETLNGFVLTGFFRQFLPVMEGLEKALGDTTENSEYVKGVKMLLGSIREVLEKNGLRKQKALGERFDPEHFEAAGAVESEEEENIVLQVIRDGYIYKDKILRPAQVLISRKKEESRE